MSSAAQKFFLTTPIYYVNARPHIGHAYTTIVADVLARRHRLLGDETFFLTGTDEHGQKIERSAAAAGIPPQQFADQVSQSFKDLWARMGITNDAYIRTTDAAHKRGVQKLFADLHARGQIYLSSYTGQYSIGEEMFVEGPPGTIGPDGKPTETVTEENFFFRLSNYQLPLLDLIESDTLKITPEARKNEVLSFLRGNVSAATEPGAPFIPESHPGMSGSTSTLARSAAGTPYVPGALKDLSVSRSSFTWGIPVPEPAASEAKEKHVIYVWLDALANYMTALGYGADDAASQERFAKFWPADLHLVGKEIIRFHCVYWPAFLLAAKLPLPKAVTAHGWLLFDDAKMSKSKGNIVRTETILDAFGTLCPPAPATPSSRDLLSSRSEAEGSAVALTEPDSQDQSQKGTLSGVPQDPTFPLLSSRSEAEGSAVALTEPDSQDQSRKGTPSGVLQDPAFPLLSSRSEAEGSAVALTEPASQDQSRKGTLSGVPQNPTFPLLSSRSEAEGSAVPFMEPTAHDRDLFAADVLRYFLLREIPFGQDGSFSFDSLVTRYNADLANGYGNLVSRVLSMIQKYFDGTIPAYAVQTRPNWEIVQGLYATYGTEVEHNLASLDFAKAVEAISMQVTITDRFLTGVAPWKLAGNDDPENILAGCLYYAAESIRIITAQLHPILPYATTRVWAQLGLDPDQLTTENREQRTLLTWGGLQPGTKLGPLSPIFPRADKKLIEIMTQMEQDKNTPIGHANAAHDATPEPKSEFPETSLASQSAPAPHHPAPAPIPAQAWDPAAPPRTSTLTESNPGAHVAGSAAHTTERPGTPSHTEASSGIFAAQAPVQSPQIAIDDFVKIDLRVARILVAERIPKADKLLRLEVDLGYETRQILSGIAEHYTPEELIGRRIVIIANLAPRKMRGLESHGMLLAASDGDHGKPILATFPEGDELPLGSRLK